MTCCIVADKFARRRFKESLNSAALEIAADLVRRGVELLHA